MISRFGRDFGFAHTFLSFRVAFLVAASLADNRCSSAVITPIIIVALASIFADAATIWLKRICAVCVGKPHPFVCAGGCNGGAFARRH